MDKRLPLGLLDAPTLRMLLEKEHARRAELEQDIVQLRASLDRQNAVLLDLQRRDAARVRKLDAMETVLAAVTEQNRLLREQVAHLEQENARLRGVPLAPAPDPPREVKPASPVREPKIRKKRAAEHNHGRRKRERATRWETYAAEQCPQCGEPLMGGWIVRRVHVVDLAPVAPLEITEHRILRRQCPRCGRRVRRLRGSASGSGSRVRPPRHPHPDRHPTTPQPTMMAWSSRLGDGCSCAATSAVSDARGPVVMVASRAGT